MVVRDGKVIQRKKVGRPRKDPRLKENIVGIRLSRDLIERLKRRARQAGHIGWQTYLKQVLEEHLSS